jgi:hypothetical protein
MSEPVDYGLVEPFGIDNGELSGLSRQECFTLGVEWQMFREKLDAEPGAFSEQVHMANVARLSAMCRRRKREVSVHWLHEDHPDWRVLNVGAAP